MTTVLVVDRDPDSRRMTGSTLRHFGYEVRTARRPEQAASAIRCHPIDALIIDPEGDEPERLLADLRPRTDIPILVVSAPGGNGWTIRLLDAGADDYLPKPVVFDELLARLRVALRHAPRAAGVPPISTAHFTVDLDGRRVTDIAGAEVPLTPTEWRLTEVLVAHPGHLCTQAEVLEAIWGTKGRGKTNYLRVYMTAIRHKLEPDPARPRYFLTVPGVGLRFVPEGRAAS
jgi:two-component system KDP operon response regulator KdpE